MKISRISRTRPRRRNGPRRVANQPRRVGRRPHARDRHASVYERRRRGKRGRDEGVPVRVEDVDPVGIGSPASTRGPSGVGGGRFWGDCARRSARPAGELTATVSVTSRCISGTKTSRRGIPVGLAITGERRYDRLGSSVSLSSDGAVGSPSACREPTSAKQDDRGERTPGRRVCSNSNLWGLDRDWYRTPGRSSGGPRRLCREFERRRHARRRRQHGE